MSLFSEPWMIWALVGLGLMILELMVPGMVIFFFGLGALVTAVATATTGLGLTGQLSVFLLASVASFALLRRWCRALFQGDTDAVPHARDDRNFTGAVVRVVEPISPPAPGKVELNGALWNATAGQAFAAGDMVRVVGRQSITLEVAKA